MAPATPPPTTPPTALPPTRAVVGQLIRYAAHYRKHFFDAVRDELALQGIEYRVLYGEPWADEQPIGGVVELPWATKVKTRHLSIAGKTVLWHGAQRAATGCDVIMLEQQVKAVANYLFLVRRLVGGPRIILTGHGRNHQTDDHTTIVERSKEWLTRRADWFFAYTENSADIVAEMGFPRERVTVFTNALDNNARRAQIEATTETELATLRSELGLGAGPIGAYIGRIYPDKRPDFLIDAALELRALQPDFELLIIGDGNDRAAIDAAAAEHPWIHDVGARFDSDLVRHALLADVILNPGAIGLVAIDSLALGRPIVTVADTGHGPEMAYLKPDFDCIVLDREVTPQQYATTVSELFDDRPRLVQLQQQARSRAHEFSMEDMVATYAAGFVTALETLGIIEPTPAPDPNDA
ncbi:MAG: glycosyltransferase family 4 protein [Acidimicrobiales bacterium]